MSQPSLRAGLVVVAGAVLAACGGGTSGAPPGGPVPTPSPSGSGTPVATAAVAGRVVDGQSGAGLGGAAVTVGGTSTTAAADGSFRLAAVPVDVEAVTVSASAPYCGYTSGVTVVPPQTVVAPIALTRLSADEAGWIALVDADRAANGAGPLACDEVAMEAARAHASDMAANAYYSHDDLLGRQPYERYAAAGGVGYENENIAAGQAGYAAAEAAFLADPVHRAQLLDPHHDAVGVGIASSGGYAYYDQELLTFDAVYDPATVPASVAAGSSFTIRLRTFRGAPVATIATGALPLPTPLTPATVPTGGYSYPSPLAFVPVTVAGGGLSTVTLPHLGRGANVVLGFGGSYETGVVVDAR